MKYNRDLDVVGLLSKKSHFLFGARGTGKSTLIKKLLPEALNFDLLDNEIFDRLLRAPKFIEQSIESPNQIIVIDEVQRLPKLLNEVQRIMASHKNKFLLTGSSARKLKMGSANLLGGRAWEAQLFPLTSREITDFELIKYLNRGGLPSVYTSAHPFDELKNYVNLYLREEVLAEALTRNIEYFVKFLDIMALTNGEELFFQGLSSESGVPARTIQNYVEILEDTLIGFQIKPFLKTKKRKAIARSKFFLFDLGVVNHIARRGEIKPRSELFGRAFEHFIIREVKSAVSYLGLDFNLCYWRSTSQFEVDLIIGTELAIEIKSTDLVNEGHLKGLLALKEEGVVRNYCVVSNDPTERTIQGIKIYPWQTFVSKLWTDRLLSKRDKP